MNENALCVPVPVVPVDFSRVPLPLLYYITNYILISYRFFRKACYPVFLTGTTGTGTAGESNSTFSTWQEFGSCLYSYTPLLLHSYKE